MAFIKEFVPAAAHFSIYTLMLMTKAFCDRGVKVEFHHLRAALQLLKQQSTCRPLMQSLVGKVLVLDGLVIVEADDVLILQSLMALTIIFQYSGWLLSLVKLLRSCALPFRLESSKIQVNFITGCIASDCLLMPSLAHISFLALSSRLATTEASEVSHVGLGPTFRLGVLEVAEVPALAPPFRHWAFKG